MPDPFAGQVTKQLADLRLQVNALEVSTKSGSLPEMLKQTRRTILWSAVVVAVALLASSIVRVWDDTRVRALERRVETLERARKVP